MRVGLCASRAVSVGGGGGGGSGCCCCCCCCVFQMLQRLPVGPSESQRQRLLDFRVCVCPTEGLSACSLLQITRAKANGYYHSVYELLRCNLHESAGVAVQEGQRSRKLRSPANASSLLNTSIQMVRFHWNVDSTHAWVPAKGLVTDEAAGIRHITIDAEVSGAAGNRTSHRRSESTPE